MYGLINRITAVKDRRDELAAILAGISEMPGCLSYIVALEDSDSRAIWVSEVWESAEAHSASLGTRAVQEAIEQGRPLIERFDQRIETKPTGGTGLP